MKNEAVIKILSKLRANKNSPFWIKIKRIRKDFEFPDREPPFRDFLEFEEWNTVYEDKPQKVPFSQEDGSIIWEKLHLRKCKLNGFEIIRRVFQLAEDFNLIPTYFTQTKLFDLIVLGEFEESHREEEEVTGAFEFNIDRKDYKNNYFYFLIHGQTSRDDIIKNWTKNGFIITSTQNRLQKSLIPYKLEENEDPHFLNLRIFRDTRKQHIKDAWNYIREKQKLLPKYEKKPRLNDLSFLMKVAEIMSQKEVIDNYNYEPYKRSPREIIEEIEHETGRKITIDTYKKLQSKFRRLENGE